MAASRPFPSLIALENSVTNVDETVDYVSLRRDIARAVGRLCPYWMADWRDDLVQSALLRVMHIVESRNRSSEGNSAASTSYLYKVAYSVLVDELRRRRRRRETDLHEDAVLVARLTPGHTRGCTTWTMKVTDGGRTLDVVIIGSPNVNPGYKLVGNEAYPQIAQDFERTFQVLNSLPVDIFLGAHGSYYDMEAKVARMGSSAANPFIDPQGYRAYVANRERAFRAEWARQRR